MLANSTSTLGYIFKIDKIFMLVLLIFIGLDMNGGTSHQQHHVSRDIIMWPLVGFMNLINSKA